MRPFRAVTKSKLFSFRFKKENLHLWLLHIKNVKPNGSLSLRVEFLLFQNPELKKNQCLPLTSHNSGKSNVHTKGGRIPYVRLVSTTPGHITLEYRPWEHRRVIWDCHSMHTDSVHRCPLIKDTHTSRENRKWKVCTLTHPCRLVGPFKSKITSWDQEAKAISKMKSILKTFTV